MECIDDLAHSWANTEPQVEGSVEVLRVIKERYDCLVNIIIASASPLYYYSIRPKEEGKGVKKVMIIQHCDCLMPFCTAVSNDLEELGKCLISKHIEG